VAEATAHMPAVQAAGALRSGIATVITAAAAAAAAGPRVLGASASTLWQQLLQQGQQCKRLLHEGSGSVARAVCAPLAPCMD
jgi:hypothetical protein